jgi:hypothetical protein
MRLRLPTAVRTAARLRHERVLNCVGGAKLQLGGPRAPLIVSMTGAKCELGRDVKVR